jgi:hypothetical protein
MDAEYKWENCKACVQYSRDEGRGKRICESCSEILECSKCGNYETEEEDTIEITISKFDGKPLCLECYEHECSSCGLLAECEDALDDEFYWFDGNLYCEECARTQICNQCGGDCDYRCPSCERVHDCDCECEIECTHCGEEFNYVGSDMVDRSSSEFYSEASKEVCDECWEKLIEIQ